MSDQPSELHETMERRLLAPGQVALLHGHREVLQRLSQGQNGPGLGTQ